MPGQQRWLSAREVDHTPERSSFREGGHLQRPPGGEKMDRPQQELLE